MKKKNKTILPVSEIPEIAPENKILVLRTCTRNDQGQLTGYGGFPWPESGPVTAPERWNPEWGKQPDDLILGYGLDIQCGGGLHGISEIDDDWGMLNWDIGAQAMIVATDATKLIRVGAKIKFQFGIVERLVSLAQGICQMFCTKERIDKLVESIKSDCPDYSQLAASGHSSQLAASGDYSKLAASGHSSVVIAASPNSSAKAGNNGVIALSWSDGTRPRITVGYIGENGIKADTTYKLDNQGNLIEA